MTNSIPEAFIAALVGFLFGLFAGQFVSFRRVHHNGDPDTLKWGFEKYPLTGALGGRIFRLMLVGLFLIAVAVLVSFTYSQRHINEQRQNCDVEFQVALKRNSAIATEDRSLEARDDALRDLRDVAGDEWLRRLMAVPRRDSGESRRITQEFQATVLALESERALLNVRRAELEQERRDHPLPEPRC